MGSDALVLIVDENPTERDTLRRLLSEPSIEVETLSNASSLLERRLPERPVCVVADLHRAKATGFHVQQTVEVLAGLAEFVFVAGSGDIASVADVMKAGAVDCIESPVNPERLVQAVRTAIERARQRLQERAHLQRIQQRLQMLTPREREVLPYVISGWLNKQIALDLGISEKTIKVHRGRIMHKLEATCLADLIRIAMAANIAPIPRRQVIQRASAEPRNLDPSE